MIRSIAQAVQYARVVRDRSTAQAVQCTCWARRKASAPGLARAITQDQRAQWVRPTNLPHLDHGPRGIHRARQPQLRTGIRQGSEVCQVRMRQQAGIDTSRVQSQEGKIVLLEALVPAAVEQQREAVDGQQIAQGSVVVCAMQRGELDNGRHPAGVCGVMGSLERGRKVAQAR